MRVFPFVFIVLFLVQFGIVVAVVVDASLLLCLRNEFNLQLYLFFMLVWADSITARATIPNSKFIEIELKFSKWAQHNKSSCMVTLICTACTVYSYLQVNTERGREREGQTENFILHSHMPSKVNKTICYVKQKLALRK